MTTEQVMSTLQIVQLVATLGIFPLAGVLWALNSTLTELRITLHRDFVTKSEMEREIVRAAKGN